MRTTRAFIVTLFLSGTLAVGLGAQEAHFYDAAGKGLPRLEAVYDSLKERFGASVPERMTVASTDRDGGWFNTADNSVHIGRNIPAESYEATVAHECAHLCMGALTKGASTMEEFRFLDEGYANIFESSFGGRLEAYKVEALALAEKRDSRGEVSFAKVRDWSEYFGDPSTRTDFGAYLVGSSFDLFVADTYGEDGLFAFFADIGETRDLDKSSMNIFKKSASAIEGEWRGYLARASFAAPRVVSMFPSSGAVGVDPGIAEIRVEFDSPMAKDIILICPSRTAADVSYKNARWESSTVLAVKVRLTPNTTYSLALGSDSYGRFKSAAGIELPVTPWTFATSSGK